MLSIFSHVCWPSESLLWKNAYQLPCPFLNRIVCFLLWDIMSSLYILDINPYKVYDLQIFSPIWYVAFSFCWWFSLLCKNLKTIYFWLYWVFIAARAFLWFRRAGASLCGGTWTSHLLVSSLTMDTASRHVGFSGCSPWLPHSRALSR